MMTDKQLLTEIESLCVKTSPEAQPALLYLRQLVARRVAESDGFPLTTAEIADRIRSVVSVTESDVGIDTRFSCRLDIAADWHVAARHVAVNAPEAREKVLHMVASHLRDMLAGVPKPDALTPSLGRDVDVREG